MHLRHLTGEKIKAITEAICEKLDIAPEQLPEVQWGEANSRKLWEAVAEATGFKVGQLRGTLRNFKLPSSKSHRPEFEARLRVVAPQWFGPTQNADVKKAELMAMAMRGEPRPASKGKHPLGEVLLAYTRSSHDSYDPVFDQEIRTLAPGWFADTVALKKAELLAMAISGEPRPSSAHGKHPLGQSLSAYTGSKNPAYDPVFDQEIRALAPGWFEDTVALKKAELKAMALRGESRPGQNKHPLGKVLGHYTDPKSKTYDSVFDQEIRTLAPHWFVDTAALNKAELKALALRGDPRPNQKKHPRGMMLSEYTDPKSSSYDPMFDQEIRALRPDWFTRSDKCRKTNTTKKAKTP